MGREQQRRRLRQSPHHANEVSACRRDEVIQAGRQLSEALIVAEIDTVPREPRRGWDVSRNRAVKDEYAAHVAASVTAVRV